jgi:alpha-D-xyloside xylohydrolase
MINKKKGWTIDLLNFNTHIPTPIFMSSKGYGLIWNSAAQGRMEFGPLRTRITSDSTTLVDCAIVSVPQGDYDILQQRLSALTGRAPTPPDWSLGYLHSKLRYESQSKALQLAQNFVKYKRPRLPHNHRLSILGAPRRLGSGSRTLARTSRSWQPLSRT